MRFFKKWRQRRQALQAPWTLEQSTNRVTGKLYLEAIKPGQGSSINIYHPWTGERGISFDDKDFDLKLYFLRSEGERVVDVLNGA